MADVSGQLADAEKELHALCAKIAELRQKDREHHSVGAVLKSGERSKAGLSEPVPEGFVRVIEGTAASLEKQEQKTGGSGPQEVFYNPAQVVNRDLSILVIRCYDTLRKTSGRVRRSGRPVEEGLKVLEALAATGLRTVRYWKEIPGLEKIVSNDIDPSAVAAIRRNLRFNSIPETRVQANCDDAVQLMYRLAAGSARDGSYLAAAKSDSAGLLLHGEKMDVVDLDPYGTAAPFLDGAVSCAEEGALLCVTCTDSDCLCGVHTEVAHHKYGALTVRGKYCHEMAVRILLGCIERHAIRHGKHIKPLLSLHIDFYVRVFVRVFTSKAEAKLSIGKMSHLVQCSSCAAFWVRPIGSVRADDGEKTLQPRKRRKVRHGGGDDDAQAEAAAGGEDAAAEQQQPAAVTAETLTAAIPPLPPRSDPRLKYVASNSILMLSTERPKDGPAACACSVCGRPQWIGGPIWGRATHDRQFVEGCIEHLDANSEQFTAKERVRGLLAAARDELSDCPLYYHLPSVCSHLKAQTLQARSFIAALHELGYRTSEVHCNKDGIKTDAPPEVVYDVLRCWIRDDPTRSAATDPQKGTVTVPPADAPRPPHYAPAPRTKHPAEGILSVAPRVDVRVEKGKAAPKSKEKKFVLNPEGWGPKARAKAIAADDDQAMEEDEDEAGEDLSAQLCGQL
eukprot:TRINITY_DN12837_c0_g1_i1.p1 TRINITY_DN12837_c0_g1~~TRINITY_DN12837_c0_g1_i1.p1  ORF type:complete len:677 (+),score=241.63 TRINITY_DN12837_c0_g1_i1:101-2131(+)